MNDEPTIAHVPNKHDLTVDQRTNSGRDPSETVDTPAKPAYHPDAPPGFTILGKLGEGGMGVVYLAMQDGLKRKVALKMIRGAADEKSRIRFLAESESIAAIRHPNVVEVYHYGVHNDQPYLVLEYCEGGSLNDAKRKPPSTSSEMRETAQLMAKIAEGVQAAHALGIVHRVLKPHNVLLTKSGEPKVADFGLAKIGDGAGLTQTNAIMGTPAYMPPEQAKGEAKFVGPTADVWALGVMLYEVLTGRGCLPDAEQPGVGRRWWPHLAGG